MNAEISQKENLLYRTLLALVLIVLAAALRITPHPWNFTPVGAMALFSGAVLKDRRLAFLLPLLALFIGDTFIGFHKLMLVVYASFLLNVARPPHRHPRQSRYAPRRHPVFPRHQFRRLAIPQRLPAHYFRPPRLLRRRPSLLLEHARGRRHLRPSSLRQLRSSRTLHPCAAPIRPARCVVTCRGAACGAPARQHHAQ